MRNTECFLLFIIQIKFSSKNNRTFINYSKIRGVVPGGAGGAFGRSVNPISTRGGRLCLLNNTDTSGFSDLPTALNSTCKDSISRKSFMVGILRGHFYIT